MSDHERVCQRAGCQQPATVTLSFRYDARQASLVDLSADKDPAYYDLCATHADVLIVPRGWERLDRRTPPPEPEPEPAVASAEEIAAAAMDRYAVLTAQLPSLARAWGASPPAPEARPVVGAARSSAGGRHRSSSADAGIAPLEPEPYERDPAGEDGLPPEYPYEPVTRSLLDDEVFELEGQLQMPIEPEVPGVVVALTRSRDARTASSAP